MASNINEKTKRNPFFKDVLKSIKDFDKYEDFALEGIGRTLIYIAKMVAILVLAVVVVSMYRFSVTTNKAISYFEENIKSLQYADGIMQINNNEKLVINEIEEQFGTIIIDTSELDDKSIESYREEIKDKTNAIVVLKDKILLKTSMLASITETSYTDVFENYSITSMDKQEVLTYFYKNQTQMYISISIVLYIYMFMVYFSSVLIDIFMLAIIAYIVARIMRMKIRFGAAFGMGAHALTLPILLNLIYIIINYTTGFTIKYFQIMYTGISYIYIMTALLMIRSDYIKKQMELEKIKSEQEKIREELESKKQQEDEQKEEEKENQEREKQRKKEEDKNKENNSSDVGNKPEGSNA